MQCIVPMHAAALRCTHVQATTRFVAEQLLPRLVTRLCYRACCSKRGILVQRAPVVLIADTSKHTSISIYKSHMQRLYLCIALGLVLQAYPVSLVRVVRECTSRELETKCAGDIQILAKGNSVLGHSEPCISSCIPMLCFMPFADARLQIIHVDSSSLREEVLSTSKVY